MGMSFVQARELTGADFDTKPNQAALRERDDPSTRTADKEPFAHFGSEYFT